LPVCWRKKKQFFFEKKNQKTFFRSLALPARLPPNDKSFLVLFFKKEPLSCLIGPKPLAFRSV